MKIVFTGGGTGGHFYPIIAVAQKVNQIISKENIVGTKLYYISDVPYDNQALFENSLIFEKINAGKTIFGILGAIYKIFLIYPDVIFSKGGYAAFPVVFAAKMLRIPVVIHESDAAPGRVNVFASKFAKRVAVSFKDASSYFPKNKTIYTGQPIRTEIEKKQERDASLNFWKLESDLPILLILGGSQGAELINNIVIDALPELVKKYQIIHQTGVNNFKNVKARADVVLADNRDKAKYIAKAFLNPLEMKNASGAATLIVSRAGSTIFEIASWGVPSILVPFTTSNADHSKKNAFAYARVGACVVIEEMNMKDHILISEIDRIVEDKQIALHMSKNALNFYKPDASNTIAREIIDIALSHEK